MDDVVLPVTIALLIGFIDLVNGEVVLSRSVKWVLLLIAQTQLMLYLLPRNGLGVCKSFGEKTSLKVCPLRG